MNRTRRGIVLMVVVGLLTLLAVSALGLLRLGMQFRGVAAGTLDGASAGLLARSGLEYAAARLFEDAAPRDPQTVENQADDWTYRDGPKVPLEESLNPSYARSEAYSNLSGDGGYTPGSDSLPAGGDWNRNGRFDAWSGRLRERHGRFTGLFKLKISSEQGKIPVNQGIRDGADRNGNGVPDHRDLGKGRYSVGPATFFDLVTHRNRRMSDLISTLWLIAKGEEQGPSTIASSTDVRTVAAGRRIVEKRPLGGYQSIEQVRDALSAEEWRLIGEHLSVQRGGPKTTFGILASDPALPHYAWVPEERVLLRAGHAHRQVLQALLAGLSFELPNAITPALSRWISVFEAARVAEFVADRRDSASWHGLYLELDRRRTELFVGGDEMAKVDVAFSNFHPDQAGVRNGVPGAPPFSWQTYDLERLDAAGRIQKAALIPEWNVRDRRGVPYKETIGIIGMSIYRVYDPAIAALGGWQGNPSAYSGYGTMEVDLSPAGQGLMAGVVSLGEVALPARIAARKKASAVFVRGGSIFVRSQRDFENPGGATHGGIRVVGRPSKDRLQTYPMFPLDSFPEAVSDPDYAFTAFAGDLRLMDFSPGPGSGSPVFYIPAWEAGQPLRSHDHPVSLGDTFRDSVRGVPWRLPQAWKVPEGARDILLAGRAPRGSGQEIFGDPCAHGPAALHRGKYVWGDDADPGSRFPLVDAGSMAVTTGTIECWSAGSENLQMNPMRCMLRCLYGAFIDWCQLASAGDARANDVDESSLIEGPVHERIKLDHPRGLSQDWFHLAVTFEGERVALYADGIRLGEGAYQADAVDPSWRQAWICGYQHDGNALFGYGQDEVRLFPTALPGPLIATRAQQARFWAPLHPSEAPEGAHPGLEARLAEVPSFTSPLYVPPVPVDVTGAAWDGYVPALVRSAVEQWNSERDESGWKTPLRVDLLLYPDPQGKGAPDVLELPRRLWKTGGGWTEWAPRRAASFRYRVWMDVSAVEGFNNETPVLDSVSIGYRSCRMLGYGQE